MTAGPAAPARFRASVVPQSVQAVAGAVNRLAWPIIMENLFQTALGTADMIMVGSLGADAIAGVGSAAQIIWVMQASISALTTGTTVLVARLVGGEQPDEAGRVVKQSLSLGLVVSLVFVLVGRAFPAQLVAAMGAEAGVVQAGATYLRVVLSGSIFLVTMLVASGALRGAGDTRTPMIVTGLINVVNVAVAYGLIYGHFGLPKLGVAGSAWGATTARAIGTIALLAVLAGRRGRLSIASRAGWGVDLGLTKRLLRLGLPSMAEQFFLSSGNLLYGVVAISLGTAVYATQRIAIQLISFAFMPGMGFAMAATAMVGQCLGARRSELSAKAHRHAVFMAVILMSLMAGLMAVFGRGVMRLFTRDALMIAMGAQALWVIALSQPFQAIGQVTAGSLRGAGDTRFPMLSTFGGVWLLRLPFGYLFGVVLGWGLPGIFIANVIDGAARAAATTWRFRTGCWRNIRV